MIYIQRLVIRNHKVIRDLTLDFDGLKPMTVFIGENGSGKTTVLEALTAIFAALHQRVDEQKIIAPSFDFELVYLIRANVIIEETTTGGEDKTKYVEVQVKGKSQQSLTIKTVVGGDPNRLLSKELVPNLVIYYPGSSDTLLHTYQLFTEEQEKRLRSRATSTTEAYSRIKDLPVFYYQKQHFDMLLASLLSFEYSEDINDFFADTLKLNVVGELPITVFIKPNKFKRGVGPTEFWGAEGEVRRFLELIRAYADHESNYDSEGDKGLRYNFSLNRWYRLREQYADEKTLFLMLNMLDVSGLFGGIITSLERRGQIFLHFQLSEGERQLIVNKGLAELLFDQNTLFLLDEPNVFMHPGWQSQFMENLDQYTERANFIITTHSPIILSNIHDGHLVRMNAGEADFIKGHYYGRQYSDNLEDFMDTPARAPKEIVEKLQVLFDLIDEERYDEAEQQLIELRETLGDDDSDIVRAQTMLNFYR